LESITDRGTGGAKKSFKKDVELGHVTAINQFLKHSFYWNYLLNFNSAFSTVKVKQIRCFIIKENLSRKKYLNEDRIHVHLMLLFVFQGRYTLVAICLSYGSGNSSWR
jgi:hypothetical protein